jgi:hypothetical protein
MKDFIMIQSKEYLDIGENQRVYVFSNTKGYEEQIQVMLENSIKLDELQKMIESWGGNMEVFLLNDLIKNFKKNNEEGFPLIF